MGFCLKFVTFLALGVAVLVGLAHRRIVALDDHCEELRLGEENTHLPFVGEWESSVRQELFDVLEQFTEQRAAGQLDDPAGDGVRRRVQHPHTWACVDRAAIFIVDIDNEENRLGFLEGRVDGEELQATLRFSPNAFDDDGGPKILSAAIKLHGVAGERTRNPYESEHHAQLNEDTMDLVGVTWDMLPIFSDPAQLVTMHKMMMAIGALPGLLLASLLYVPTHIFATIGKLAEFDGVASVTAATYTTVHPYKWGDGAAKFVWTQCGGVDSIEKARDDRGFAAKNSKRFIAAALQDRLNSEDVCFEMFVQRQVDPCTTSIDNLFKPWPVNLAPHERIGRLVIPQHTQLDLSCEDISFNPGHMPDFHRPLGYVPRVRDDVYAHMAAWRHEKNSN